MSERELAKQIIDKLPEYKISSLLLFLRGIQFDDDIEDDLYCEKLVFAHSSCRQSSKSEKLSLCRAFFTCSWSVPATCSKSRRSRRSFRLSETEKRFRKI